MATINELLEFDIIKPKLITDPKPLITTNEDIEAVYEVLKTLDVNLGYFLQNASTVQFVRDEKLSGKIKDFAYYDAFGNVVKTSSKNHKYTVTHELLHMASTIIEQMNVFLGFHQCNLLNNRAVGEALNEGYTAILDARLFGNYAPMKAEREQEIYPITKRITEFLEVTVGTEQMTKSYFEADLRTITDQLTRLMGRKETLMFLYTFDALFKSSDSIQKFNIKAIHDFYPEVQAYTAEAFYTKITDKYRNGSLNKEDYLELLNLVKYMLYSRISILKIPVTPDLKDALPHIEERYESKYKRRQKNNCLVK